MSEEKRFVDMSEDEVQRHFPVIDDANELGSFTSTEPESAFITKKHISREAEVNHQMHADHLFRNRKGCLPIALGAVAALALITSGYFLLSSKPEGELKIEPENAISEWAEKVDSIDEKLLLPAEPVFFDDIAYVIDPGHGGIKGENVGTELIGYGVSERDYVLDIANRVSKEMKSIGYSETEQTRTEIDPKLTLKDRKKQMNADKKNVGVSIHVNGCGDSSVQGVRVYYNNEEAKEACGHVADALKPIFGKAAVKPNNKWTVMTGDAPVVYVELGFGGSNGEDARILMEKKVEIANAIAAGLIKYHSAQ